MNTPKCNKCDVMLHELNYEIVLHQFKLVHYYCKICRTQFGFLIRLPIGDKR